MPKATKKTVKDDNNMDNNSDINMDQEDIQDNPAVRSPK